MNKKKSYKCPNCGEKDNYKYLKYDDECECKKCGEVFNATGCEVEE